MSNRGHDSIAVIAFDEQTGHAEFVGTQETFGHVPRNHNLDPTATFLLVVNQKPGNLVRFRVRPGDHWPEPEQFSLDVPTPSCIILRPIPA